MSVKGEDEAFVFFLCLLLAMNGTFHNLIAASLILYSQITR